MKKRFLILLAVIILAVGGILLTVHQIKKGEDFTFYTTLSICAVTEKTEQDGIYCLTVQLEDWTVEEYSLPSNLLTMRTTESVYAEANPGGNYIGISLTVTIPGTEPKTDDIGVVLKGGHTDYCKITTISTADN